MDILETIINTKDKIRSKVKEEIKSIDFKDLSDYLLTHNLRYLEYECSKTYRDINLIKSNIKQLEDQLIESENRFNSTLALYNKYL